MRDPNTSTKGEDTPRLKYDQIERSTEFKVSPSSQKRSVHHRVTLLSPGKATGGQELVIGSVFKDDDLWYTNSITPEEGQGTGYPSKEAAGQHLVQCRKNSLGEDFLRKFACGGAVDYFHEMTMISCQDNAQAQLELKARVQWEILLTICAFLFVVE